jgi:hypothetical protein
MAAAYIEHRPLSQNKNEEVSHHVIIVDGKIIESFKTQSAAKDAACKLGYRPVHVARERHLQNRDTPAHWRKDPC